ncbi:MAG: molybdopterin-dependent oxidoreductase [Planctomycetota bacterium]
MPRPDPERRRPPGQHLTTKWPVLHEGRPLAFDPATWRLRVHGAVERPRELRWDEVLALPQVALVADFHCVTTWSRLDMPFKGVRMTEVAALVGVLPECRFVRMADHQGYDTSVPLEVALDDDVLLALEADGAPLSPEHGGPLRSIIPKRYGWKSCKWLVELEFLREDRLGYWEQRGYSNSADPWREERFG